MNCRRSNKDRKPIIFAKRRPLGCLLFFLLACCHAPLGEESFSKGDRSVEEQTAAIAFTQIGKIKIDVKSGDLILRTGKDFTSEFMRRLSQSDKTYSHCGIASWEHDTLFVYHALGGEWNPDGKLRRDKFEFFCNPYENRGFGIFRYLVNEPQRKKIVSEAQNFYRRGVMFDPKFDLKSDDRMYCSEFVYKTIKKATNDSVSLNTTTFDNHTFVAPDNLFIGTAGLEIKRIIFH